MKDVCGMFSIHFAQVLYRHKDDSKPSKRQISDNVRVSKG